MLMYLRISVHTAFLRRGEKCKSLPFRLAPQIESTFYLGVKLIGSAAAGKLSGIVVKSEVQILFRTTPTAAPHSHTPSETGEQK